MKFIILVSTGLFLAATANATIEGPSCGELTSKQKAILTAAAKNHVTKKASGNLVIPEAMIKVSDYDCHDYDGVHSRSEFEVEWLQVRSNKPKSCRGIISVEVNYTGRVKTIDEKSTFEVDEDEIKCKR